MPTIDALFDELLRRGASDLHLSVGHPPLVRLRGELTTLDAPTVTLERMEQLLFELLDDERRSFFEQHHDLDFAYTYGDQARFRANYFIQRRGPAAVFRTIPGQHLDAAELALPPSVTALAELRSGLVLVTGPTGSGKTTTLAAMVAHINRTRDAHVLTLEDPVEFVHAPNRCLITHREIGLDSPSFPDALRSALRENADVILVGSLETPETMRPVLDLAGSGTLVLATIHTSAVGATVERFVNAFSPAEQSQVRSLLADALAGIISQQLLRRADGTGRVAAFEVLVANPAVAAAIRECRTEAFSGLIQAGAREGMQTMDQSLEQLVAAGVVRARDALERVHDKQSFAKIPAVAQKLTLERTTP